MNNRHPQMPLAFPFRKESTFDSFLIEKNNQALSETLRSLPGSGIFPVYLWGETGSGRTHLLQALCLANEDSVYLPLGKMAELSPTMLEGLESLSVVCLDDIHLLAGRTDWQEAVFRLFNELNDRSGSLVVASDEPPSSLTLELADLVSRLQWGPVYQVQVLSESGKGKALKNAAAQRGITMKDELINYILHRADRRMDRLLEVLDRLDALSLVEKRRVTQPFVREIMGW